ncbi:uncharacterized protein LOC102360365 [Latimeria chalumnae]|uniref:uncharacterized protein LOC102360365 n=1 Tax=Latimeria chalumnae TaxID=7897 RepID=UPI0003C10E1D|nr:PREDICTED: uncharacterized protein LOC102360365 [Latimeria chalumnae]|eukprot:XP_005991054.1 PREDICTED: uncharacterized protein LOC102360365 [Latimeria chalumnae]
MDFLGLYLFLVLFCYLPSVFFEKRVLYSIHSLSGMLLYGLKHVYCTTAQRSRILPRRDPSCSPFKAVERQSDRTFWKWVESPSHVPYPFCLFMYWALLVLVPVLPRALVLPWVLHCSLDQLLVLYAWHRSYRTMHTKGEQDLDLFFDNRNKYLTLEDYEWRWRTEEECDRIIALKTTEMALYSIDSPEISLGYKEINDKLCALFRTHKLKTAKELQDRLSGLVDQVQVLTKQCVSIETQKKTVSPDL